ncbi:FecR family protein [Asticcacaulis sp. W401b]|uniref:FecR family protein n=1 Tax=Asticcacaulis sp. W401b TaxID=3388666 RepID=UPI0039705EA6
MSDLTVLPEQLTEAAAWLEARRLTESFDEQAFFQWLTADPRHEAAWTRVCSIWASFDDYKTSPELLSLRTRALQRAYQMEQKRWNMGGVSRRGLLVGGSGVAAAVAVAAGVFFYDGNRRSFATAVGEMKTFLLPDQSLVTLDANSVLNIHFNGHLRQLDLVQGRAHFDVAHDAARPFQVSARDQVVTALGTDFTVDLRPASVTVALFKGKVVVADKPGKSEGRQSHELLPLQELTVHGTARYQYGLRAFDSGRELAWREGRLIFDNERLADAVDRMNNYAPTRILVAPDVADLRMDGMFMAGQTAAFVEAVQALYPVRVERNSNGLTLRRRT